MARARSKRSCFALAALLGAIVSLEPHPARACAVCACGDPTLTVMGTEQANAGRMRWSTELRYRSETSRTPVLGRVHSDDLRLVLGLAVAPAAGWLFSLEVPWVARIVQTPNLAQERSLGPGDANLRVRWNFWQDRAFAPRHVLAWTGGLGVPMPVPARDRDGKVMSDDAQTSLGAWLAESGVFYGAYFSPWAVFASARAYGSTRARSGFAPGPGVLTTLLAQFQPQARVAVQGGVDARLAAESRGTHAEVVMPAGHAFFATTSVLFSPVTDLLLHLQVRVPLLDTRRPAVFEGSSMTLGLVWDV